MAAGLEACAAQWDVHVHLPAGAVQKDGPSAGITLAAALASLFGERCARADTAMTGELTLRGLVLPVGGIKEKLLAAHQAGMHPLCLKFCAIAQSSWGLRVILSFSPRRYVMCT